MPALRPPGNDDDDGEGGSFGVWIGGDIPSPGTGQQGTSAHPTESSVSNARVKHPCEGDCHFESERLRLTSPTPPPPASHAGAVSDEPCGPELRVPGAQCPLVP
ncbi:hypothetical protein E5288_WYG001012 [Bos mutus]|uniref:Uncharacterized protein n=1 Tax=Bos mutus TaxID=72004 RepID=A0A6B0RR46_9CETA|nr:hypothetical protein [Bos mutus]